MKNTDSFLSNLDDFKKFSRSVNIYACSLKFNKDDKQSMEDAVNNISHMIDGYVYKYPNNRMIREMAADLKKIYKRAIFDKPDI
ncbi:MULTISPECIES: hypothetical protein [Acinetobacter]|uniref:Uncharacterized protein n=2 Tax=Acinetobacter TaxID=469 RepID=N8W9R1_9GAMM|nr:MULTISPECIES: hypothetical protein [Acinetobacter]ENU92047.1 hypothetical protein F971_03140 [Acinetobacter vivianii]ENW93382.1 hypothetical protein F904_01438 [Acinetobacter dispersus]